MIVKILFITYFAFRAEAVWWHTNNEEEEHVETVRAVAVAVNLL